NALASHGSITKRAGPAPEVPPPEQLARGAELEPKVAAAEADLPNRFPLESDDQWETPRLVTFASTGEAKGEQIEDGSIRLSGPNPDKDTYTITFDSNLPDVSLVRL